MNYCSIDEAWHTSNIMNNYVDHLNRNQELIKEYYNGPSEQNNRDKYMGMEKNKETYREETVEHFTEKEDCDKIMMHINNCKKCYDNLREHFTATTNKPITNINIWDSLLTKENKEILSYMLIGIIIVIILDIVYSLGKMMK